MAVSDATNQQGLWDGPAGSPERGGKQEALRSLSFHKYHCGTIARKRGDLSFSTIPRKYSAEGIKVQYLCRIGFAAHSSLWSPGLRWCVKTKSNMFLTKLSRKRDLLSVEHRFSFLILAKNEYIGGFFSSLLFRPRIYISPVNQYI